MQIDKSDYLILKDNKKKYLTKVTNIDPLKAIVCDEHQKDRDRASYIDFDIEDIVANLGKKPLYGDAYRVPIEYVRQTYELEPWGSIVVYKELGEEQFKKVWRSVKRVTKELQELRIFPTEKPINLQVKELKGTEGGHYMHVHNPKADDRLVIRATEFNDIDYILRHEMGHGVWFQMCNKNIKARWVKVFVNNVALIRDTEKKIRKMRQELVNEGSIKAYKSSLDGDDPKELFAAVLKYLKEKYVISGEDIDCLIEDGEDLTDIWPDQAIPMPKSEVLVTEYAKKNVKELFSECFAYHLDDTKELPKSLEKLMKKTIEAIRYGRNAPDEKLTDDEE